MRTRFCSLASAMIAAISSAPAWAQSGADSMKNHVSDTIPRATQHWHFDGKVSTINPGAHRITISADNIPTQMGGGTTLEYDVPDSVSLDIYHVGDRVNGDMVVRGRTIVENVKLGPTPVKSAAKSGRVTKKSARVGVKKQSTHN